MDASPVVRTDCCNGRILTGNRTQEVVGSIPISSTTLNESSTLSYRVGLSTFP